MKWPSVWVFPCKFPFIFLILRLDECKWIKVRLETWAWQWKSVLQMADIHSNGWLNLHFPSKNAHTLRTECCARSFALPKEKQGIVWYEPNRIYYFPIVFQLRSTTLFPGTIMDFNSCDKRHRPKLVQTGVFILMLFSPFTFYVGVPT